ncbi:MAG TPA: CHAT domain-containing tetratricopeptide repeat protein [Flavobacteriales bacterium]
MRCGRWTAVLVCLCAEAAHAQAPLQRIAARHALIDSLYHERQYAATAAAIDAQITEATGTPWQDSLYTYTYRYARSVWRSVDAEAGVAAGERLRAIVERADADIGHRLRVLEDLSMIHYEVGRMKDCVRIDSTALALAQRHASTVTPLQLGKAYHFLAFDHGVIGDHAKAIILEREAVKAYERALPLPRLAIAESHMGIGTSSWHSGRIQQADRAYATTLEVIGDHADPESMLLKASAYGNRGILWQASGDVGRSKESYLQAIAIQNQVVVDSKDPKLRDQAVLNRTKGYVNLATVYFALGDLERSGQLLDQAWRDRSAILEPDDPQLLRIKERMADLESERGDHAKAERHLRAYLAGMERAQGRNSTYYADACYRLAVEVAAQGQLARADSLFDVSIAICHAIGEADTGRELEQIFQERAEVRIHAGQLEAALHDLARALPIGQRIYGPRSATATWTCIQLAETYFLQGDLQRSMLFSDSALAALTDLRQHLAAGRTPPQVMAPHQLAGALYWRVRAQRAAGLQGRERQWADDIDMAIASLQQHKTALSDEASRLRLLGAQKRIFDLALDLAYEDFQRIPSTERIQRFLDLAEADRSILLKARLDQFAGMRFAGVPDAVIAREEVLLNALAVDEDAPLVVAEMDRNEAAYRAFLDTLQRTHPRYHALRHGARSVPLAEVRHELLSPSRHLLLYAQTDEHLYTLVVRLDTTMLVRTPSGELRNIANELNASIAARNGEDYARQAYALYQHVFAPIDPLLTGDELLVVSDGVLHTVNLEVLLDARVTGNDIGKHLLLRRFAMAQLLSVTTAMQFAALDARRSSDVLALAPGFTDEMKQRYVVGVQDTTLLDRRYLRYARQPFAVRTAEGLRGLLSARVMVGDAANEPEFRAQASKYGILHLGTHAEMNPAAPMYSRLVLGKNEEATGADGYLHAYEIYELDLQAQLAVLTACETGTGKEDDGEGVRSLGYGFAYAGCPSLVMSLWKIDEKVSSEIITRFYEYLAQGLPKHKALQRAKLDHLDTAQDELALPYYWAGMVLVGDVAPLELGFWQRCRSWIVPGALLIVVAGLGLVWRRRRTAA